MSGRIFGIKKSFLLKVFAILAICSFIALTVLSVLVFKIPELWFYSFCLCFGIFEVVKSFFFKLDSSFYLGNLAFYIGIFGYIFIFTNQTKYAPIFILSAFIISSLLMFLIYKQRFHLILFFSLIFVTVYSYLLINSLITTPIFIAFVVTFLVLLVVTIIIELKRRN